MKILSFILPLALVFSCSSSKPKVPKQDKRLLVIVSDVLNATGDKQYQSISDKATSPFISELTKTGQFRLIERQRLNDILKEMKLGMSGLVDSKKAKEIGKILGADGIILIELANVKYDSKEKGLFKTTISEIIDVTVSARVVLSETGEILASSTDNAKIVSKGGSKKAEAETAAGKLELIRKAIDNTASDISEDLGEQISKYYKNRE